jgi:ABC-2 type transport system ATP-binding protein
MHSPEILILDEPTTGLDPNQIKDIRDLLRKLGKEKTVILSTHILGEVEAVCGRVLILNGGRIVAEGAPEVIAGRLKGKPRFRLEIRAKSLDKGALTRAAAISEVVSLKKDTKGIYHAEVITEEIEHAGESLFDWAVEQGFKILSMVPIGMSLEEVFGRLTTDREEE